jgi:hypothetical protein
MWFVYAVVGLPTLMGGILGSRWGARDAIGWAALGMILGILLIANLLAS